MSFLETIRNRKAASRQTATERYAALVWRGTKSGGELSSKDAAEIETLAGELGVDVEVIASDVEAAKQIMAADAVAATKTAIADELQAHRDAQAEYDARRTKAITALNVEADALAIQLPTLQARNSAAALAVSTAAELRASNPRLA